MSETALPTVLPAVIVLAEDDADDRLLISRALRSSGMPVSLRLANDGEELLEYLHAIEEAMPDDRPSLILLDLNMPRKNGYQALEEIKTSQVLRRIPTVVLTTSSNESDIVRCYMLGANAFVTKPTTFSGLEHMFESLLGFWLGTARLPA